MVIPLDSAQVSYDPPTEYPDNEQDRPIDGLPLVSLKPRDLSIMANYLISWFDLFTCVLSNQTKVQDRELGCFWTGVWRGQFLVPVQPGGAYDLGRSDQVSQVVYEVSREMFMRV